MSIVKKNHHEQQDLCKFRPQYRQGKKLTAVKVLHQKVYTVTDESTHLLVINVPAINLQSELCNLCNRFGTVTTCMLIPEYECQEQFVETYHVQYARIQSARFAKKQLDGRNFFGGLLHVCYAPELETVDETRAKLFQRRKEVTARVKGKQNNGNQFKSNKDFSREIIKKEPSVSNTLKNHVEDKRLSEENNSYCLPPYSSLEIQQIQNKFLPAQEATTSRNISNPTSIIAPCSGSQIPTNNQSSKTTTFIPRPLAISKRIVFHNKNKKS